MTRGSRGGVSSIEVLVAAALAAVLGLGMFSLVSRSNRETAASEDYMFIEALALRIQSDVIRRPLPWLEERLEEAGGDLEFRVGHPEAAAFGLADWVAQDAAIAAAYPGYGRAIAGSNPPDLSVRLRRVEPGLTACEVRAAWSPKPGASRPRRYALMRLIGRKDLAVSSRFPLTEVGP